MLRKTPYDLRAIKGRAFPRELDSTDKFERFVKHIVLANFMPVAPFLTRDAKIVTLGSCFAANIAMNLSRRGYSVHPLTIRERLFNAFALHKFVEGLGAQQSDLSMFCDQWNITPEQTNDTRAALESGSLVIITLGLSFVWFDNETNEMIFDPTQRDGASLIVKNPERFEMRATNVPDNFNAIIGTINSLWALNPQTKIVLTLSPLPMTRAICDYPVTAANAISKATLRCALHEVLNLKLKNVYYFPSYELLRELASMIDVIWFEDGILSHIRAEWTAYAMSKFMQYYCVEQEPSDLTVLHKIFGRPAQPTETA